MPPSPEPGPLLRSLAPPPDQIEPLSLSRIAENAGDIPWSGVERELALRIAYAVGDATVLRDFACSAGAVEIGVAALRRGAPIVADVRMVVTGIDRRRAARLGVAVDTRIDDPKVASMSRERGITRSAQAMLSQAETLNGAVVAIGNAPTALLALLDLIDAGIARPALILGFPVGYVAAAESKTELQRRDVPFVTIRGHRGGTPMAVAAANTLLRLATVDLAPDSQTEDAPLAPNPAGRIRVIGIGADGLAGLGERARSIVARARTLYGGARHLSLVPNRGERRVNLSAGYADALAELLSGACGDDAVVLASGDPMLYGIGSTLARRLGSDSAVRLDVIPQPSSVHIALSRLGVPTHDVVVLSALARPLQPVLAAATGLERFAVLLDPAHSAPVVAQALLDGGMEDAAAIVCERLGATDERIVRGTLGAVASASFDPLSLLLVFRSAEEVTGYRRSAIPEAEFAHRAGQITKAEVRALAVAALRLRSTDALWDIGAGSGSVGIEAALGLPGGSVYAVDRDAEQIGFIQTNRVRYRTPQVEAVHGAAPDALAALPDPDAVFVGGGATRLVEILDVVKARLRLGGRVVVTLATLERVGPLLASLAEWSPELRQIAIAHGVPLADGTRLSPANPILLISATKPDPRS